MEVSGRELRLSNPAKVFFPERGLAKLNLARYYVECQAAVARHVHERPTVMKRWVDGVSGEALFHKRVPPTAPDWIRDGYGHVPQWAQRARDRAQLRHALGVGRQPWRHPLEPLAGTSRRPRSSR